LRAAVPGKEVNVTLTQAQSAKLTRALDALEREVRDKIRASMPQLADQKYIDLVGVVYDSADEAMATMQEEVDHTLLEHYLQKLKEMEAARARISSGEANICTDCGDEIGFKRLHAYPFATRCIHCQTVYEKTHGTEAAPRL
jgi:phage/conjugal plasmid C-4 type zinc finger TraR family protein